MHKSDAPRRPMKSMSDKQRAKLAAEGNLHPSSTVRRSTKRIQKSLKPLAKLNPERQAKRRKSYAQKLAAYRKSQTYRLVEARAEGRCERIVRPHAWSSTQFAPFRCWSTRDDGYRMTHNHKTYARFGGNELPGDIELLCDVHNVEYESQHPTRRRGRAS